MTESGVNVYRPNRSTLLLNGVSGLKNVARTAWRTRRRRLKVRYVALGMLALMLLLTVFHTCTLTSYGTAQCSQGNSQSLQHINRGAINQADCEMCDESYVFNKDVLVDGPLTREAGQDKMALYRHYTGHQPWPAIQAPRWDPSTLPPTVHYLWCRGGHLRFDHYLGILSALRLLQPLKLVFHYTVLPVLDDTMYHSWFLELKQSLPHLVLKPLPLGAPPCGSRDMLLTALSFLQPHGGILLGSDVILARVPRDLSSNPLWFAFNVTQDAKNGAENLTRGIVVATKGFGESTKGLLAEDIIWSRSKCVSVDTFNRLPADSNLNAPCVVTNQPIFPQDIMYANTSMATLSRWLFYGTRSPMLPKKNPQNRTPRISHLAWFGSSSGAAYALQFYQFLTILSALHVGGFDHVYIHGNARLTGPWWQRLQRENVTSVWMDDPELVYQQTVANLSHKSDVARYEILSKYGGAYHDFEAVWTQRVPDWLLDYPCVATREWVHYGHFNGALNPGVLLSQPGSAFIRHNLAAHRYYVDTLYVWNALLMTYRTYERHPDQLLVYPHLQVMCSYDVCHPTWEDGFYRRHEDLRATLRFDWRTETLAVHIPNPEPYPAFLSPRHLQRASGMFADIGRNVLEKSGRLHLLGKPHARRKYGRLEGV